MDNSVAAVAPWNKDNANQPFVKEKVKAAAHKIFMQIATGRYSFGARLDAERQLADELGLTRTTIRQAFDFLEHYDIVKRRPNSGTFVVYRASRPGSDLSASEISADALVD